MKPRLPIETTPRRQEGRAITAIITVLILIAFGLLYWACGGSGL